MKKALSILVIAILLASCNRLDNKLRGGWIINKAFYHDHTVIVDLSSTAFDLLDDYTCSLPISVNMINDTLSGKGVWSCYENNDTIFCNIKTKNTIFNRNFRVLNYTITQKSGFSPTIKASFSSDSLKLECTKIIF